MAGKVSLRGALAVERTHGVNRGHQRMMARPGELVVIQRGMRFKVTLPDGPVRGCKSR